MGGFPGLLYANGLILCSEFEEEGRAMVGGFKVCRQGLKVDADKNNGMFLN